MVSKLDIIVVDTPLITYNDIFALLSPYALPEEILVNPRKCKVNLKRRVRRLYFHD